ncbi:MAG: PAS domain S-box protein [Aulosira sp. ZfuVER01]|nr:PAS domain S-box protein [Aulosira sp. ZfuVER01]MDZ7996932.1 PAS domain S-box protein [Aulosira sp. DedVER01a]MDZ8050552.1 PAS domain S-box protein [Aulosira sp. ZfuCHP01]
MILPKNEQQRLELLHQYQILDTPPEEIFDDLAQLAADVCDVPIALISLVDAEREWFKSKVGINQSEIPRCISFGTYTILESEILIIPDILQDQRFAANPLVISAPYCCSYAGVPLITANGFAIGSLCVFDSVPRNFSDKEQAILKKLARQIIKYLDFHREKIIHESQKNFNILFLNHPNPMWVIDCHNLRFLNVNNAAVINYGYSREEFLQLRLTDILIPEDVPVIEQHFAQKKTNVNCSREWKHRRKDGQIIDVEVFAHSIEYAGHNARLGVIRDITNRKKIEQTLHESEARLRAISEAIPIPLFISRLTDGLILYANQEFSQTFLLDPEDLINSRQASEFYHNPDERQLILEALAQQGYVHNHEVQFKRPDGTSFWAIASVQFLTFNGESAILKAFYDITDRKNAETNLQQQNKLLRNIFESIPLMISLIDVNGKLQWVNQEWERILGWNFQDFQNCDVLEVLYPNPEDYQYVVNFIQSAQKVWCDFRTQTQAGRVIDTSWTNVNLENGQIIGIGQNITERKQTEQALKTQVEREQLMRTVTGRIRQSLNLQDILDATVKEVRDLLQVDRVIVLRFASDMSATVVAESVVNGWTASIDAQIVDTCFQTGGGKQYYQGHKRAIANIYEAGLTECHINLLKQFEVKANLVVPILLQVSEENPGSGLWGLLIAHQCSRTREWEEHQLDLLDQLSVSIAIAIQQSTILQQAQIEIAQRQKAEVELRSALAEKEVLLKEIHHRVKNNLQIVSSLLQLQSQTLTDPEVIRVLRDSQNRIDSISLIHRNLYTAPNIGQLDVADYIQNLATSLLISYQVSPAEIGLETDIDPVSLNVDQAIACGLIINELISNALKHAFPNQKVGNIIIRLRCLNDSIEMTISDNGIGFQQDVNWRDTNSLGLSLVYDLVTEQLEGTITLETDCETVFKIIFPQLTL